VRYIISENRLNKVIDNFITQIFEPDEIDVENDVVLLLKNGSVVGKIFDHELLIKPNLIKMVSATFDLEMVEIFKIFKKWVDYHHPNWDIIEYYYETEN
jgi:hypothetical protein